MSGAEHSGSRHINLGATELGIIRYKRALFSAHRACQAGDLNLPRRANTK